MSETRYTEYIAVGFSLRWGAMRFLRVKAEVFPDEGHESMLDLIQNDYKNVVVDRSPATGNGVAVSTELDTGVVWFKAPSGIFTADVHDGYLYSITEERTTLSTTVHLGFPSLLRDCVGSGVWSVSDVRMSRVMSLGHTRGDYGTFAQAHRAVKSRIDHLRKPA